MGLGMEITFHNSSCPRTSTVITNDKFLHTMSHTLTYIWEVCSDFQRSHDSVPGSTAFKVCTLGTNTLRLAHGSQPALLPQENFRNHKWTHTLCSAAASLLQYSCIRAELKQQPKEQSRRLLSAPALSSPGPGEGMPVYSISK